MVEEKKEEIIDNKENKKEKKEEEKKKKEKPIVEEFIPISFLHDEDEHRLIEQVFDPTTKYTQYCIYDINKKTIEYAPQYRYRGVLFKPIKGEELTKEVIKLPSCALEYDDDDNLDSAINKFIYKWFDVPNDFRYISILNIKRSWIYDRFYSLNYLHFLGDMETGKSRALKTIGFIHYKNLLTSGATTPAPIFRLIDRWKGTLIIDEADFKATDESQDIIKIINLGYERGQSILRMNQVHTDDVNCFDPYCPKLIATRRMFEDKAIESRCFTHIMTGTMRKDIPFELTDVYMNEGLIIRNMLLMWRFRNYLIDTETKIDIDVSELEPRLQQMTKSFYSLLTTEKKKNEFILYIKEKQESIIESRQNSFEGDILNILKVIMQTSKDITCQDIVNVGNFQYNGRPSSPKAISSKLHTLGIKIDKPKRVDGIMKRCIILDIDHINRIFSKYGIEQFIGIKETADEFGLGDLAEVIQ